MSDTPTQALDQQASTILQPARILIVDDHELLRNGLRDLIHTQPQWQVCSEAADESQGLKQLRESSPELIIVDLTLQDGNGLDLIKRIKQVSPGVRVLVLSMHDENLYAERALRAGADGYVNKQQPSREILNAIGTVLAGGIYLSQKMSESLLHRIVAGQPTLEGSPVDPLSDRELEIFALIGQGLSTEQIALRLHLSRNTIGTYRERIKSKLSLNSSSELTRAAAQWVLEHP